MSKITNIILDMDGTILDYVPGHFDHNKSFMQIPIARPYLNLFMKYLFENFERVSIWTAAAKSWFDQCYEKVIKPSLPEGKELHFVKTRENYDYSKNVKPLRMIYDEYPDLYNHENTIIIDDNPYTFAENVEQAIQIKSFYYDRLKKEVRENLDKNDFELYNMIQILHLRNNPDAPPLLQSSLIETTADDFSMFIRIMPSSEEDTEIANAIARGAEKSKKAEDIEIGPEIDAEIHALYNSFTSIEDW